MKNKFLNLNKNFQFYLGYPYSHPYLLYTPLKFMQISFIRLITSQPNRLAEVREKFHEKNLT